MFTTCATWDALFNHRCVIFILKKSVKIKGILLLSKEKILKDWKVGRYHFKQNYRFSAHVQEQTGFLITNREKTKNNHKQFTSSKNQNASSVIIWKDAKLLTEEGKTWRCHNKWKFNLQTFTYITYIFILFIYFCTLLHVWS